MNNLSYLNEIDSDIVEQAANIEQHIRSRRKKKTAIISGATGLVTCFMLTLGVVMWNGFDNNGVILTPPDTDVSNTESVQTPAQTTPKVTPPIADNNKIVWNNGSIEANRLAATFEDVTQEEWLQVFSFIPAEVTAIPNVSFSLVYSMSRPGDDSPIRLLGGHVQLDDGLEEPEQFLMMYVWEHTPDTKPLEEITGISDIAVIDFELSLIGDTKAILSKIVDETGIWGSHVYGAFDCGDYRIEFEGRNVEDVVIDFIKNCKPATRIIAENQSYSDIGGDTINENIVNTPLQADNTPEPPVIDEVATEQSAERRAEVFVEITKEQWAEMFAFVPVEVETMENLLYYAIYRVEKPGPGEDSPRRGELLGGDIISDNGIESSKVFSSRN